MGDSPSATQKEKIDQNSLADGCFAVLTEQIFSKTRQAAQVISVDIAKPLNEVLGKIGLLKPVWV